MQKSKPRSSKSFLASILFLLITLALFSWAVINRQYIIDYVKSSQFSPSASVKALRDKLDLTANGLLYFNASKAQIEPASSFNQECQQTKETNNPILGCYSNQRIYVFDVTNQQLDGIEETTAAHELLHAVYERMNADDKKVIDTELEKVYQARKTPDLEKRMEYYKVSEPGQEMNELHSILGTEMKDLGPVLEAHYAKYFNNRARIVAFYDAYNSIFTSVTAQLKTLSDQINSQTASVNTRITAYNDNVASLSNDTNDFKRRNQNGEFSSVSQFNSEQRALIQRQNQLNAERDSINAAITAIVQIRIDYNKLVDEYNDLNKSINSSLTPAPSFN